MIMILKYYKKRIVAVLFFTFFSGLLYAQNEVTEDSVVSPPEEQADQHDGKYQPGSEAPAYFLQKEMQSNGGMPDSLRLRKLPDTVTRKMAGDKSFWYVNYVFKKQKEEEQKTDENIPLTERPFFQTMLWLIIIAGFTAFVIIYLGNSQVSLFRRKDKTIAGAESADADTTDIFGINYQREIDKAIKENNYRLAVRLLFLRLLANLADKRVINYKQDKTNFDYLSQLHRTSYYNDFFRLTRNYEYCWYGQFDIDPEKFAIIKNDFENFDSRLK